MAGKNPNQQDDRSSKKRLIDRELSDVSGGFVPIEVDIKTPSGGGSLLPAGGGNKPLPGAKPGGTTPRPGGSPDPKP
jgi:hypothetical protein